MLRRPRRTGTTRISFDDLEAMGRVDGAMVDFDPIQCSTEMWSWLSLNLGKSAHANRTFSNSQELNGAEVYRRLVTPQLSTSIILRNALRDMIQCPQKAKSMSSVMDAVDLWEADLLAYTKAGGKQPEEDEMCAQLMNIVPTNLSFEMLSKADDMGK